VMTWRVFISFRVREARPQALALKAALEAATYPTFCSEVDIPGGSNWEQVPIQTSLLATSSSFRAAAAAALNLYVCHARRAPAAANVRYAQL
jgi:hypothetical protein